ncbi:metallophosphoesterase [Sciscionella marina]|uniref:metallophosphoesterase n=1 Tax=Sciscionella marina TaxID=508770 RepID=UPI0003725D4D|nr:metallophosphoesterase [Sciscionella marina]
MSTTLLQLSDPHISEDPGTVARLRRVLEIPSSRRPDAIIVTGDVADNGRAGEYRAFGEAMAGGQPWIAIPGNHDHPDTLREVLGQQRCPALDVGPVRVIGLDVTVPGADHGLLDEETVRSAEAAAAGAGHVVLALHQPPVPIGHAYVDAIMLRNPEALTALVQRIPGVRAILSGHVHTPLAASLSGVPVRGAPGIVSALTLAPDPPEMRGDCPPGMALHHITEDGDVTTTFHPGF